MGFPDFPNVCAGLLPTLVINVAMSIAIIKSQIYSLFRIIGPRQSTVPTDQENSSFGIFDEYSLPSDLVLPNMSEEVREALPLSVYNPDCCCSLSLADAECSVCLSDFQKDQEVRQLPSCNHVFHRSCLDRWLDHLQTEHLQMTCPLCRVSLVPDDVAKKHKKIQRELEEDMMLWFSPIQGGGFQGLWCQI